MRVRALSLMAVVALVFAACGGTAATTAPTAAPSAAPTAAPTAAPSAAPTAAPSAAPTAAPSAAPTAAPSAAPTAAPSASTGGGQTSARDTIQMHWLGDCTCIWHPAAYETFSQAINFELMFSNLMDRGWAEDGADVDAATGHRRVVGSLRGRPDLDVPSAPGRQLA